MKKYILYILPLLAVMTACKELDKYPLDSVNSEVYFQNASQLEQYSNQFYTIFPGAANMYNEPSDEISITELSDEVRGTRLIPSDASGTNWNWSMLRRINYMLEHINQCSDESIREQYKGLAYFFRAYLYYDRIRHYGDVPWIDKTVGNDEVQTYAKRDCRTVVMQHVIEDLDNAYKMLPDDKSNVYRVNRWTALALKSRVCLFEGTFCKYHTEIPITSGADRTTYSNAMLKQAYQAAEQLMNEGGYQLYKGSSTATAYRELFASGKVQGMNEYILARCYSADLKLTHNVNYFTMVATAGHPGFTKRFVNKYLCSDGTRFTDKANYDKIGMAEEMTNRDARMEQTVLRPGHYIRVGETVKETYTVSTSATGYQLIKYVMGKEYDTYSNSDCDMPLFRLAEVYLNYAEAKAELGEFTQADADKSINLLRQRVGMPDMNVANAAATPCPYMKSIYPNVSQDASEGVILEIRRERDVELVQEGFHYWDLMRWKEGKSFEKPFLGLGFKGVSRTADDENGLVDVDGDGFPDLCAWKDDSPFFFGIDYMEVGKDIELSNGLNGGNIVCNGSSANLNDGRVWREDRDYLYPIPIRERVLSNGAITQNPGWDDGLTY